MVHRGPCRAFHVHVSTGGAVPGWVGCFVRVSSVWLVVFDLVASGYHSVTGSRDDISHCNIVLPFAYVTCQCLLYRFQSVITFMHF